MSEMLAPNVSVDPYDVYVKYEPEGITFAAGYPGYPANFSRDVFNAGNLVGHVGLLHSQLTASARRQGTKVDPLTGEEHGKIHHEFPGTTLAGRGEYETTYNACDTTPLFLIALEGLQRIRGAGNLYEEFTRTKRQNMVAATDYVLDSLDDDGILWDAPPPGASRFALEVDYWKDSMLPQVDGKIGPDYPVSYALAQFIAARGILSAARVLDKQFLERKAEQMYQNGIRSFISKKDFTIYRDATSELQQASSDELHALAYIPPSYKHDLPLEAMQRRAAEQLATPIGYMCTPYEVGSQLPDGYHGNKVWVFDQGYIHYGARKFALPTVAATALQVHPLIGEGQELFDVAKHFDSSLSFEPLGNSKQLWSVATREYFDGRSNLSHDPWL